MLVSVIHQLDSAIDMRMYLYGSPSHFPPHPTPLGCHRAPGWAPWVKQEIPTIYFIYGSGYISMLLSPFVSASPCPLKLPYPRVCSLRLHLHCCPANRFISTILLDSIYSAWALWGHGPADTDARCWPGHCCTWSHCAFSRKRLELPTACDNVTVQMSSC